MAEKEINANLEEEAKAAERAAKAMATENKAGGAAPDGSLPPPIKKLKGTPMEETVKIWARQSKQGSIQICDKKGCYYPLSPQRDPANNNDPKVVFEEVENDKGVMEKQKVGIIGLCSWGGADHEEQVIRPPKKEDEL